MKLLLDQNLAKRLVIVVRITLGNCKTDEILTLLQMRLDDLMAIDNDDDASFLALP